MFKNILQDNGTLMDIQEVEVRDEPEVRTEIQLRVKTDVGENLRDDATPDKPQENPPNTVIQYLKKFLGIMG